MKLKNAKVIGMNNALEALAQGGVKDERVSLRLTRMIMFIQDKADAVIQARNTLVRGLAKDGEDGNPQTTEDGKSVVFENPALAEVTLSEFLRSEDVEIKDSELPKPFTWADLNNSKFFKKVPDASLIVALGPLVKLPLEQDEA